MTPDPGQLTARIVIAFGSQYEDGPRAVRKLIEEEIRAIVTEALKAEREAAIAAERDRCAKILRDQIVTYRRNAEVCPNRKAEFDGLAESAAMFEALILERYDP